MHDYKIYVSEEYEKQLKKINKKDRLIIENKMKEYVTPKLIKEPHVGVNIKKLKNYTPPTWRYRIGKYRLFYDIDTIRQEVDILTIIQRKDAY